MQYLIYSILYVILNSSPLSTLSPYVYILLIPHFLFWSFVLFYEYLDKYYENNISKVASRDKNINIIKVIKITVRNQIINICFMYAYLFFVLQNKTQVKQEKNLIFDFVHFILHGLLHSIIFYGLHVLMHVPKLANIHKLHHGTLATRGITALYMTILDFIFEAIIPVYLADYILLVTIGSSTHSLIVFATFGYVQVVVTHSGYNLKYLPTCIAHYNHHNKLKYNYSSSIIDKIFKTNI